MTHAAPQTTTAIAESRAFRDRLHKLGTTPQPKAVEPTSPPPHIADAIAESQAFRARLRRPSAKA